MKTMHACVRGLLPSRYGIRIKQRGTPGVDEEYFMIFSWTHHVMELECQQDTRHGDVSEAQSLSRRINNWELDREKKAEVYMPFDLFRRSSSLLRRPARITRSCS